MSRPRRIRVSAGTPYDVVIGNNLLGELAGLLGEGVSRVAVIHPRALRATGDAVREDLTAAGFTAHAIEIPDAEDAKTAEVASYCWSLLGLVDAAVGDKTVINTAEGKNLVGAFWEPAGVLCDLAALETLPRNDYVSGLAEVVKCGFIADPVILDLVEAALDAVREPAYAH